MLSISDLRENYSKYELLEENLTKNPIELFDTWFKFALETEVLEPNAMTLSTVSLERKPRSRVVLLKDYSNKGFSFYTNYQSDKGREIELNNNVSLNFYWSKIERQVRIEGKAIKLSFEENDNYFNSRPMGSKIGAIISRQSRPVNSRDEILKRFEEYDLSQMPERPKNWGGFIIKPILIEFWQGRPNRLHDRIKYIFKDNRWSYQRLEP
ncbi:MAG: pyridoxamine 5'-phosphate oxidase [Bacteroidetes bacterium]|nr:pyridoxamine 5'-phosphate oxidase [Bacteroidota bacterium]